ncbi:GNAT family N-acetyltransferase [Pseudalkalibacillus hwajinpoensis]|uniref:GNAT family N-acetyltransferase n=1 Tax=Guptibacillus hwajinpoensis TaxID=208199 RepID=UPI00325C0B0A
MLVTIADSKKEMDDAFQVRHTVFVEEQQVPADLEIDEYEKEAIHFVAYDQQKPAAAGRFRVIDGYAKVERICVLSDYRKTGLGKQLMDAIEEQALKMELHKLKLNAQTTAIGFYQKLGYQISSEEFMDAGIPHVTMVKTL